ncbi:MAG: hypothetical protein H7312_04945 [Tardiphaga sp.]|nr:hypothetical protein [Tardiphaga sp.]
MLRTALPGLSSGALKPFPIQPDAVYALADARAAYLAVRGSSRDRIILDPRR